MLAYVKNKAVKITLLILAGLMVQPVSASVPSQQNVFLSQFSPSQATIVLQAGGFNVSQGREQDIGAVGLIGDHFTVNHQDANNALIGLGYYVDGLHKNQFNVLYGLNAFYFANTTVKGDVIQEHLFTNLSYHYSLTYFPIYLATKAFIKTNSDKYDVTFDLGVGPNFITSSHFRESSLDGGVTLPDTAFSGRTSVVLSATAGVGLKFNNLLSHFPCELSYRFFYLGHANLHKDNSQLTNTLTTGNNYANALIFSLYV